MKLNYIAIKDKILFNKYFSLSEHFLSVYSFQNIFIWKKLYDIFWLNIKGNLCVFFQDKIGCFLYLPPLGNKISPEAVSEAFKLMDSLNSNPAVSRIENIEEKDLPFFKSLGYECRFKSNDYVCLADDLASFKGDKFKSKRSSYNYFIKHYGGFKYLQFILKYKDDCLGLFDLWQRQRCDKINDPVYQGMINDSRICLNLLFDYYRDLDITGRLVQVDKEIKAFSFGYKLNRDTFCILYEITDLSIKGLAQFIFREFSGDLKDTRYINIMDDSGLENLKKLKFSYHPIKLIPAYIARRRNTKKHR